MITKILQSIVKGIIKVTKISVKAAKAGLAWLRTNPKAATVLTNAAIIAASSVDDLIAKSKVEGLDIPKEIATTLFEAVLVSKMPDIVRKIDQHTPAVNKKLPKKNHDEWYGSNKVSIEKLARNMASEIVSITLSTTEEGILCATPTGVRQSLNSSFKSLRMRNNYPVSDQEFDAYAASYLKVVAGLWKIIFIGSRIRRSRNFKLFGSTRNTMDFVRPRVLVRRDRKSVV